MNYSVLQIESKKLSGLSVQLTKSQSQNYIIIRHFWQEFNSKLRNLDSRQRGRNWEKYGITYKINDSYYYYCGIPVQNGLTNPGFEEKIITDGNYVVFRHTGSMYKLKDSIYSIYKEIIPESKLSLNQSEYFHFERYNHQFQWNNNRSIIEIYVPVVGFSTQLF